MYFFPSFEPVCGSTSGSNCYFLTCIQISQEADNMLCYSCLFKNFPQFVLFQTIKGFRVVNEADVFLEFSCIFCDPTDVGSLISGSSAFSNSSLNIWKFLVHVLLKTGLENFEHYFASIWMECSCVRVWTFFALPFWEWKLEWNWSFLVLWPLLSFPYCWQIECSTLKICASSIRIWNSSAGIPSPPLALFVVMLPKAHFVLHSKMFDSR